MWYREVIGGNRCPIVDTWWQTETGAIMISPIPGRRSDQAGIGDASVAGNSAPKSLPVAASACRSAPADTWSSRSRGLRCCARSTAIPSATYDSTGRDIPGMYFTGDGAREDADGYFWIMGRVDDVLNVSGHRLSTMEIESALVAHHKVAEAAVVGRPDEMKGQAVAAFVTLESGYQPSPELKEELRPWVAKEIGSMAKPDDIRFTDQLPKTRSGKIMRRLLRELASSGEVKGDVTTLEDMGVISRLQQDEE